MSTIDKNERDDVTSIAGSTTSITSHCSLPEARLQLVRKKTEQLEHRRKLDLEQSRLQYEREKCALTDEVELVELELQLSNSCNVSLLDIRDPGTTAYHTDPPHESLPSLLDPEIDTPHNPVSLQPRYSIARGSITDTPLSVQGNTCYQSTPHEIYAVDNTNHCYQRNTHIVTPELPNCSNSGEQYNFRNGAGNSNPFIDTTYNFPPPVNYVPNMNYYSTTFQPSSHNYAPLPPTNLCYKIYTITAPGTPSRLAARAYTNRSDHIVNTTCAPTQK